MKEITIKSITLENYKGITKFTASLPDKCLINGRNASGKSTITDAIYDILTDKLSDGSSVSDDIRPHDINGKNIDRVDVIRSIVISVDGTETELKKVTRQVWVRPKGKTEETFNGNKTSYEINGFEKSKNEFNAWISENIAEPETLQFCLSSAPFLNELKKSTASARNRLEKLSGFSIENFIAGNPQFANIADILKGESTEVVLKKLRQDLRKQESTLKTSQSNLDYETNRTFDAFDETANAEAIKSVEAKISKYTEMLKGYETDIAEYQKASDRCSQLIAERSNMEIETGHAWHKDREDKFAVFTKYENQQKDIERNIRSLNEKLVTVQNNYEKAKYQYESELANKEFSNCPYCGQKVKDANLKLDLETKHKQKLIELKGAFDAADGELKNLKAQISKYKADLKETVKMKDEAYHIYDEVSSIPCPKPEGDKYEGLTMQINLFHKMAKPDTSKANEVKKYIKSCEEELYSLENEKVNYDKLVADQKNRISILENAVRENAQKCAEIERDIDLLQSFSLEKNNALKDRIQPYFSYITWKFTDMTQEGNVYETLDLTVDGTGYNAGLNGGAKRLAEIDLISGLQKMHNLCLPLIGDEMSTVDESKYPTDRDNQVILIARSDDPTVTIKEINK